MAIDLTKPDLDNWIKLLNTYDPAYYQPGKTVTAEEWNTLFLASVNQGNYLSETMQQIIDKVNADKSLLENWFLFTESDWQNISGQYRLIIPYEKHACKNAVITQMLIPNENGEYENSIPIFRITTANSIIVLSNKPINCKIKIEGDK